MSRAASINDLIRECVAAGYDETFTVRYVQERISTKLISAKRLRQIYQAGKLDAVAEKKHLREKAAIEATSLVSVGGLLATLEPKPEPPPKSVRCGDLRDRYAQDRRHDRQRYAAP